jgi:hypothetical protein
LSAASRVHRLRETEASRAVRPVSVVRADAASGKDARSNAAMAGGPSDRLRSLRRAPAREAWDQLAKPLRNGQGIRVLFFGITQYGKSTSVRDFLAYIATERLVDLTLIHDVKMKRPQFEGQIIHDADVIPANPPERYPATYVLRRRDVDHVPSVEVASRFAFEQAWDGTRTLLVVDEMRWALTESGDSFDAPHVRRIYCEGGGLGSSIIATKQLPQHTPSEAIGQSKLVFHRQADKVLKFLIRQGTIDERDAEVISQLDVGEFVALDAEDNFDGTVYLTPPPARRAVPDEQEQAPP